MSKFKFFNITLILALLQLSTTLYSADFNSNLQSIKKEINRDNLNIAISLLGKLQVADNDQQEKVDLLFGDIYLKINKPQKAIEYYEKVFITSDENVESLSELGLSEAKLSPR